jgi:hypothetical protein
MDALIALTTEQIKEKKKELKTNKIRYGISAAIFALSGGVTITISLVYMLVMPIVMLMGNISHDFVNKEDFTHTMTIACVLAVIAVFAWGAMQYYERDETIYEVLSKSQCEEMVALINSVPEGKEFQQAILAQNRQFIQQDLIDIRQWKKTEVQCHACKQLYDLA